MGRYGHKSVHYKDFYNNTMAGLGWLGSTDCGSHGRGPRFDPLCVHQKRPDLLGFSSHPEKSIGSSIRNEARNAHLDPWTFRGLCSPCSPCSANVKEIKISACLCMTQNSC